MEIVFSLEEISRVAHDLLSQYPPRIILFNGPMGAGKTTLIKAIARSLGVTDSTSSPTFSLVNEYITSNEEHIYHFDMYRLKDEEEAYDMGIDEYLYSGDWCFIEWAEKIPSLVPQQHAVCELSILPDGTRKLIYRRQ